MKINCLCQNVGMLTNLVLNTKTTFLKPEYDAI